MPKPHERLSDAMHKRGIQLGKRWVHIAREAGVTTSALGAIRRGEYRPSPHTAAALDSVLQWPAGTVDSILDGRDAPSPMDAAEAMMDENERLAAEIRALSEQGRQAVGAFIEAWKRTAETPGPDEDPRR